MLHSVDVRKTLMDQCRVFDLEAQIENEKPKIAKLGHYEAWIDRLSQNLVKWYVSD